jgi:anti-sigma regulatory factor (Ser/Thr protein kinase)
VARDEGPGIADIEQAMRDGSLRQSKTEAHSRSEEARHLVDI